MSGTNLPGYPTPAALRQQAAAAVTASLPTVSSINNQYGQSESDNTGFSAALLAQLRGEAGTAGTAYNSALSQQGAVNAAAQARLGQLGGGYAAGSQAAVGGLGDSAMSRLINNQAAETNYASQLPSVAAARASLAQAALVKSQQQALQQRQDEYHSAYGNALQTAEDNALQRSTAEANLGLQRSQMKLSERENAQNQAYRYAALNQNQGQFKASQAQQYQEFLIGQANQLKAAGAKGGYGGLTPSQVLAFTKQGKSSATQYFAQGTPIQKAINELIRADNLPPEMAKNIATQIYANTPRPSRAEFTTANGFNQGAWNAANSAYNASLASWQRYMNSLIIRQRTGAAVGGIPKGGTGRGNAHGGGYSPPPPKKSKPPKPPTYTGPYGK